MARRAEQPPAFVARIPDELARSKPLNAGMSRLGGEPFRVTTKQYDRAADEGHRREMAEQSMMAEAEEKKKKKEYKEPYKVPSHFLKEYVPKFWIVSTLFGHEYGVFPLQVQSRAFFEQIH